MSDAWFLLLFLLLPIGLALRRIAYRRASNDAMLAAGVVAAMLLLGLWVVASLRSGPGLP